MSERAQHTKKTSWRDSDPDWCCVSDDKNRIVRNRRRFERSFLRVQLSDAQSLHPRLHEGGMPPNDGGLGHHVKVLEEQLGGHDGAVTLDESVDDFTRSH